MSSQLNASTYGMHLTLRIADIEREQALNGSAEVGSLLTTLVDRIGMRVLAGPLVGQENGDADHAGWSGVIILYESHAAIHCYTDRREAFVDIFSCVEFSVDTVIEVLRERLRDFTIVEQNLFHRGVHWGTDVESEMRKWALQR